MNEQDTQDWGNQIKTSRASCISMLNWRSFRDHSHSMVPGGLLVMS